VQLTVKMPRPEELQAWRAGEFAWEWTAAFEVFGSDVTLPDASGTERNATPAGTYRFVIDGERRTGTPTALSEYHLVGEPFAVVPWRGITATDLRIEPNKTVSFVVGPTATHNYSSGKVEALGPVDLPDTYDSPFRFIQGERRVFTYGLEDATRHQVYCSFCSFRPWADTSTVAKATVTIAQSNGKRATYPATYQASSGRWRTSATVPGKGTAWVPAGGIVDSFGNVNGSDSSIVGR
jgi:hypothetical protein